MQSPDVTQPPSITTTLDLLDLLDMSIGTLYLAYPEQSKGLRVCRFPRGELIDDSCFRNMQIKAAAAVGGFTLEEPTGYIHYTTNRTPEFTSKFASGKVPAFEDKDGFCLFEGNAIARYSKHSYERGSYSEKRGSYVDPGVVASLSPNTTLLGSNLKEAALVDQWISFFDTEIDALLVYLKHLISRGMFNKDYELNIRGRLTRPLETVETYLAKHTFLVGDRLSLADISAATVLRTAYSFLLGKAERAKYPHTFRFYETVVNQPELKDTLSGGPLADTAQEYVPLAKGPNEDKPKAGTEGDPGSDDEKPITGDKKKNPLGGLPKSSFNLEDWKRAYSNLDTRGRGGSLEWFYEK